jgi:GNAT superfamily N-acetyltransferase
MHESISIQLIQLPIAGMETLHAEAQAEDYDFVDTLLSEWATGENRFEKTGEALCGCLENGTIVAIGGLTIDPFLDSAEVGRIRRVYVRPDWRNRGIGRALVTRLIEEARKNFDAVRLRAENSDAGRLYERLGFIPIDDLNATHILLFE